MTDSLPNPILSKQRQAREVVIQMKESDLAWRDRIASERRPRQNRGGWVVRARRRGVLGKGRWKIKGLAYAARR